MDSRQFQGEITSELVNDVLGVQPLSSSELIKASASRPHCRPNPERFEFAFRGFSSWSSQITRFFEKECCFINRQMVWKIAVRSRLQSSVKKWLHRWKSTHLGSKGSLHLGLSMTVMTVLFPAPHYLRVSDSGQMETARLEQQKVRSKLKQADLIFVFCLDLRSHEASFSLVGALSMYRSFQFNNQEQSQGSSDSSENKKNNDESSSANFLSFFAAFLCTGKALQTTSNASTKAFQGSHSKKGNFQYRRDSFLEDDWASRKTRLINVESLAARIRDLPFEESSPESPPKSVTSLDRICNTLFSTGSAGKNTYNTSTISHFFYRMLHTYFTSTE